MIDVMLFLLGPLLMFSVFLLQYKVIQAYHYEIYKYFKYEKAKKIIVQLFCFALFFIFFFVNDLDKLLLLLFGVLCLNLFLFQQNNIKFTNRVKRVCFIYFFCTYLLFLLPIRKIYISWILFIGFYLHLYLIHFLSCILEKFIMNFYVRDAKKIIKNIKVIGITGSYGKTSCKNIVYDMMNTMVEVSKTPRSFNNKVGIVKSIRECVCESNDYFICEYGVDRKGAMNKLLNIVRPNVAWVSEIGPQHLLTFKNISNIKNEKLKIVRVLKDDEYAIINNDNNYLREEVSVLKCKVITYGIKNESDIMAKSIIMSNTGSTFDLIAYGKKYKNIKISLLGEHNILNFLGAVGVLMAIGIGADKVKSLASFINPIEHRLELKTLDGVKIIDDAFNSNEVGFRKAVDVLSFMEEEKYIITPGVIEQGRNSELVNYELGRYMATRVDNAILIGVNASIMKKGMIDNCFDEKNIVIKKDFIDAWAYVKSINSENKIFLIENDVPSIYLK